LSCVIRELRSVSQPTRPSKRNLVAVSWEQASTNSTSAIDAAIARLHATFANRGFFSAVHADFPTVIATTQNRVRPASWWCGRKGVRQRDCSLSGRIVGYAGKDPHQSTGIVTRSTLCCSSRSRSRRSWWSNHHMQPSATKGSGENQRLDAKFRSAFHE
jgi:hypothetical protein